MGSSSLQSVPDLRRARIHRLVCYRAAPMRGRIEVLTVESRALSDNPLGDPARRTFPVYLPPGYSSEPAKRYPTLYALAAFASSGWSFLNHNAWVPNLPERLDRAIEEGRAPACVLVMPDCMTRYGGSQYLDSPALGRYQTHLCEEVVAAVETTFRVVPKREARGVLGGSSGGFGALRAVMDRPEIFGACASHAGDCYFELSIREDVPRFVMTIERAGGLAAFLESFFSLPKHTADQVMSMFMVAAGCAYAPDLRLPAPHALFPFDLGTGEIDRDVWAMWEAHDPVQRVAASADSLKRLSLLYLDAGTRDEWHLQLGARVLADRLRRAGVRHEHEEFDDGHRGIAYRYEVSLPRIAKAVDV